MSNVVSEATYIMVSGLLDLIEGIKKRKRRKEVFEKAEREERRVREPPPWYTGLVKVGDRARFVGRATHLVVDVPFLEQTPYEYVRDMKLYVSATELASPEWFDTLKTLADKVKERASSRGS